MNKERIINNAQVFGWEISDEHMEQLDSLECYGVTGSHFVKLISNVRMGSYDRQIDQHGADCLIVLISV